MHIATTARGGFVLSEFVNIYVANFNNTATPM